MRLRESTVTMTTWVSSVRLSMEQIPAVSGQAAMVSSCHRYFKAYTNIHFNVSSKYEFPPSQAPAQPAVRTTPAPAPAPIAPAPAPARASVPRRKDNRRVVLRRRPRPQAQVSRPQPDEETSSDLETSQRFKNFRAQTPAQRRNSNYDPR